MRRRSSSVRIAAAVTAVGLAMLISPGAVAESTGARAAIPEDRYAMAGGCYSLYSGAANAYVERAGSGFAATEGDIGAAEPFHFQATALGSYLLYGTATDYLAASEGVAGEAAYAATRSQPGAIAGGVAIENTDKAADTVARSSANAGRGASVVQAAVAGPLADWEVSQTETAGTFLFTLPETGQALGVDGTGTVTMVAAEEATPFSLRLAGGCASFPEISVGVTGDVTGGDSFFSETRGFIDLHLHMMAYEFIGGRSRCGRPWHRYGVAHALVDCPDHSPGGYGAILEQVLSGPGPHDTDGWPTFTGWPRYNSLTHEQIYYKWMERAWRGGLRLFVNLLVDNHSLCEIYPFKRNSCNEMDGVRLQAQRINELQDYIDAQSGGPGEGWFRIVRTPFEARRVINEGKLAVVLGIEVSIPLDCGITLDDPHCDPEQVEQRLDEVYDLGVRQMELVNKFDNAFSGVTGDGGPTGVVVNQGNRRETGRYWQMETCTAADGGAHDKQQINVHNDGHAATRPVTDRDALVGGILQMTGRSGAPVYPQGPHCNVRGLSPLGAEMIRGMVERGMIFDPDHMSARARTAAVDLIAELGHSGIVSSHGWADDTIYPRVLELGGVVTPYAGGSKNFVNEWRKHKAWYRGHVADAWGEERYLFGFGYGADTNGFGSQGGPRNPTDSTKVTYPFTGFGGVTVEAQRSGMRTYNVNTDGVAHYGLYPDWIEDLRKQAGKEIVDDMALGTEAYLQMWERAIGIAGNACRADVADLTQADLDAVSAGDSPEDVLRALGQPKARVGTTFEFCFGSGSATATFTPAGEFVGFEIA